MPAVVSFERHVAWCRHRTGSGQGRLDQCRKTLHALKGVRQHSETRDMNALFEGGARNFACETAAKGHRAKLYRFDCESLGSGLGACHCIELPFLLGSEEAWRSAPALAGSAWSEIETIGKQMRKVWADFARGGDMDADWTNSAVRLLP